MIKKGSIVLATAGKEKDGIYVVVKLDEDFVYLADGKRLSAFKPKKKSFKHVKLFTNDCLTEEEVSDTNLRVNAKIRKILKLKKECLCQKKM